MLTRTCLCLLTRGALVVSGALADSGTLADSGIPGGEVLLGLKKRGFGAGKWVGLGGHIEPGETPPQAAAREVREESGLVVDQARLVPVASLTFLFPARPAWDQTAEVFATASYQGEPAESDEVVPRWFPLDALPLVGMWDDARYWLPRVLAGEWVTATVTFAADCATVAAIRPGAQVS